MCVNFIEAQQQAAELERARTAELAKQRQEADALAQKQRQAKEAAQRAEEAELFKRKQEALRLQEMEKKRQFDEAIFKQGSIHRKAENDVGGKRSAVRSWRTFHAVVKGSSVLFFNAAKDVSTVCIVVPWIYYDLMSCSIGKRRISLSWGCWMQMQYCI